MKTIKYILPAFFLLFLASCDSDDDGFYNTKYIQTEGLMQVEPSAGYAVGDIIWVDAYVPKLLTEPGQASLLDVVETTAADTFDFSYTLEKKDALGEWQVYDVTGQFVDGTGHALVGYFVQGFLEYDTALEKYQYRGGINLTEAGEYRLNFSNTGTYYNKVALHSNSIDNKVILNLFSTSTSLDSSGFYSFTVN